MRYMLFIAAAFALAACGGGRAEPSGSFIDPVCMPDGSVVYHQYPNSQGTYDATQASKANCPWNRHPGQG
jgi:hypothetical protein